MRGLVLLACRAFPREHRARSSDEVVDTALLAADGSAWRTAREAFSLVVAGSQQRLRAEADRPLLDGLTLLAGVLALVNLAIALAGAAYEYGLVGLFRARGAYPYPYRPEWWWIAFVLAAAGIVLGLILGKRWLALGAALASLGLLTYWARFPLKFHGVDQLSALILFPPAVPARGLWLAPAVVLALATAAAPVRRLPLTRLPLAVVAVAVLFVLSRGRVDYYFLRWPLAALVVLAVAFGAVVPRLAVLAMGAVLAAAPNGVNYLAGANPAHRHPVVGFFAAGLALAPFATFARVVRRRLT
jgi:hypothetical protein